ncbi:MAG: hypothetical protein AAF798_17690 [Bacteroidota bacterium]
MTASTVYDSVADFIAKMNPQKMLELKADAVMQERVGILINKEKDEGLSTEEKDELDHYIVLERLIRLSKAKAQFLLAQ